MWILYYEQELETYTKGEQQEIRIYGLLEFRLGMEARPEVSPEWDRFGCTCAFGLDKRAVLRWLEEAQGGLHRVLAGWDRGGYVGHVMLEIGQSWLGRDSDLDLPPEPQRSSCSKVQRMGIQSAS